MDNKICNLEAVIHELQVVSEERDLNDMDKAKLIAAKNHLQSWLVRRERIWRQKARSYGFSMKDHNTKFFHTSIVIRRKRNEIVHLKINEKNFHGVTNLKREIRNYFVKRFS